MARASEILFAPQRPVPFLLESLRVPLLGWSWLSLNILLIWLGIKLEYPILTSILAGGVNGAVISMIAIAKVSEKFQAAATGLLTGVGLNRLSGNANFLSMAADKLHCFVDNFLDGWDGGSCAIPDNLLHAQIEAAVVQIAWTTVFVVLASLIAEWARTALHKNSFRQ